MGKNKVLGTAIVKEVCLVCVKEHNESIVLNKKLTEKEAKKVKELHGKVTGWSELPCKECMVKIEGVRGVYLIGIDHSKSDMSKLGTIYRTGQIIAVSWEFFINGLMPAYKNATAASNIVAMADQRKFMFVAYTVIESIVPELEKYNPNETDNLG